MSPKRHVVQAALSTAFGDGGGFRSHRHAAHQLTWAPEGALCIGADGATWVLARGVALWVPAHVEHDVLAEGHTVMRNLYFAPEACPIGWTSVTAVDASGLVGPLAEHVFEAPAGPARRRAERVLFDLLRPLAGAVLRVPLPADDRARRVTEALRADPSDGRTLTAWGRAVGASGRTLARAIERETGMGFAEWRTHVRIAHATRRLAGGAPVGRVATEVGYATPSAFIAAFRRVVGVAPGAWVAARSGADGGPPPAPPPVAIVAAGMLVALPDDLVSQSPGSSSRRR